MILSSMWAGAHTKERGFTQYRPMYTTPQSEGMTLKEALSRWRAAVKAALSHTENTAKGTVPDISALQRDLDTVDYWRVASEALAQSEGAPITDVDFLESSRADLQ